MVTSLPGYLATIHKAQPDEKKNLSSARLLGWNFLFLMSAQPHLEKAARWEHLGTNTKTCSEKKKESLNSSLRIAFFLRLPSWIGSPTTNIYQTAQDIQGCSAGLGRKETVQMCFEVVYSQTYDTGTRLSSDCRRIRFLVLKSDISTRFFCK